MSDSEQKITFSDKLRRTWFGFLNLLPVFVILTAVIAFGDRLTRVINPLIIAVLLSLILNPAVEKLTNKYRVKRTVAIMIVFLIVFTVISGTVIFVIPAVKDNLIEITEQIPLIKQNLVSIYDRVVNVFKSIGGGFTENLSKNSFLANKEGESALTGVIEQKVSEFIVSAVKPKNILNVAKYLIDVVTAAVIAFYLLKDRREAGNAVLSVFPYGWRDFLTETYADIEKIFGAFISGQVIIAFIIGLLETVGLWIIGTPYPILFGIIGGLSNLIPYFGPFIGAIPAVAATLIISPFKALLVVFLFVIVQQIDNNFISPKVIEGKLGVHPVATIIVVFIGGEFFGIKGMLLAVPVYAILRGVLQRIVEFSTKSY